MLLWLPSVVLISLLVSCGGTQPQGTLANQNVLYTQAVQTLVAQLTPLPPTQTAIATLQVAARNFELFSSPPTATPTPAIIPTLTLEPLPSIPMVKANYSSFCRINPSFTSDLAGELLAGEQSELLGKSNPAGWYLIDNPHQHRRAEVNSCWIVASSVTASGNLTLVQSIDQLPASTPVSTPVPSSTPLPN